MAPLASTILNVLNIARGLANHSWEWGTVSEALLEWHDQGKHSIWNNPFPNGHAVPKLNINDIEALKYAKPHISLDGSTLVKDGSAGDPASLGIPAFLIGQTPSSPYYQAAERQSDHLINHVPRLNGAISHRESHGELWADFMYMVPPFLAYYGVIRENLWLVNESAIQSRLYRQVLGTPKGPWQHISAGNSQDFGLWSSGNAWAVAGMSRVVATMRKSGFNAQTKGYQAELTGYIKEIVDGVMQIDKGAGGYPKNLLRNYLDDESWFREVSGTALIAATVFRMAVLEPNVFGAKYITWARAKKEAVDAKILDSGIVAPTVNPYGWKDRTEYWNGSPEGQAFVVMLHAAFRDGKF